MIFHNSSFEIRPVGQGDLNAILELYRQCEDFLALGPVATASLDMVLKDLETSQRAGGIFCGIYALDGTLMGVLDYVPKDYEGDPGSADLSLLMIGAPFRGTGLGTAVVEALENEIRKDERVTTLHSGVQVNNPQAIEFWQRHGFQIISGPELMPDQTTVFGLRKDLRRRGG